MMMLVVRWNTDKGRDSLQSYPCRNTRKDGPQSNVLVRGCVGYCALGGGRCCFELVRALADSEAGDNALKRLRCSTNAEELRTSDIIIEAIVESEDVKKKLFSALDKITKPSTILASNTSSISITRLASATGRPRQVIGMHFMNPPPIMKLVEIVRGADTSDETFMTVKSLAERFGKTVICSHDYPGFVVNRILMPMINEAFFTLYTGVAAKEDIDVGMKLGTNQPMGPLELADFIGLDVCLSIMKVLHTGLGDSKYCPCPLLVQYVDAGRLGRKRGIGVYTYGKVLYKSRL
ncbi:hypothetical protein GIB67_037881 [Kingdonia uniflora]|uniref:3-hydroxybutyryl-CoA dehydrogenase n=1 Tax=Kingdonia uniflora TaxID=39325 RepID=A0A7J7LH03_9MAGN|nr:hypothetical protein GIB67_037881 [Kingdonia uniflora]